jgi:hypothetical protein
MLVVGSNDGVYLVTSVFENGDTDVEHVLESAPVMRVRTFDPVDGMFAATKDGLYHSQKGQRWTALGVPGSDVYAVGASPAGDRLYAGTRPARLYVTRPDADGRFDAKPEWTELTAFGSLASRHDWGIDRHDGVAQVRDVVVPEDAPERLVAGVEVGGVYVSDDGGETWDDRAIEGFEAPHTDDVHHVLLRNKHSFVAATGSGLYRTTDAGRTWQRLDAAHRQWYFRESFEHDDVVFAGASPTPPNGWTDDRDHALFEYRDGESLAAVSSPTPDEVAVGWCASDEGALAATNRGTLLHREGDGWRRVGTVPVAESIHGRCVPLAWHRP